MAEFIEVRTTVEGHERAAALTHGILDAGLATSIDIAEVTQPAQAGDETTWQLTFITTAAQVGILEERIRESGHGGPIISQPVLHDLDAYPDWLPGQP
ncbi:hypothetical protein [Nonomuraea sp. NPDC002799]